MKHFITKIFQKIPSSGYKSPLLSYPTLLIVSVIIFIFFYFEYSSPIYLYDSESYIAASYRTIQGIPDSFRTPIYPLLIGLFRNMFGNNWDGVIVCLQYAVILLSVPYLYKIARQIIPNPRFVFWVVALYALNPGIINYCFAILTESFAISFFIFFTLTAVRLLTGPKTPKKMIWPVIWLFLLIYLRPVFVYLIPILGLFYLYLLFRHKIGKASALAGFATLTLVVVSVCFYQQAITRRYGIHSISSVTIYNNYYALRYDGVIDPSAAPTPELADMIDSTLSKKHDYTLEEVDKELFQITRVTDDRVLEEYEKNLIKKYPKDFIKGILCRWSHEAFKYPLIPDIPIFLNWKTQLLNIFIPNMGAYWLFLVAYGVILAFVWRRNREFPKTRAFLYLVCVGLFFTTVLGAQGEYNRLNLPAIPIFFILAADFFSCFRLRLLTRQEQ